MPLGTFSVVASAAEAHAFRLATGLDAEAVPLTFPMRWLAAPAVRTALRALVPEEDLVLVHEGQSFHYSRPLRIDEPYDLALEARRDGPPDRLFVQGTIRDANGTACGAIETTLRLIAQPAGQGV